METGRRRFCGLAGRQAQQGDTEAAEVEREYREARARSDREYEETAAAMAAKKGLSADEQGELRKLWKKLVTLYHPDRFVHEPDKLETYGKLTAAINRAKDSGDIETLRQIAGDPHRFILRQGWASLDFRDEEQIAQLRRGAHAPSRVVICASRMTPNTNPHSGILSRKWRRCRLVARFRARRTKQHARARALPGNRECDRSGQRAP